jgi:hypothetical protein
MVDIIESHPCKAGDICLFILQIIDPDGKGKDRIRNSQCKQDEFQGFRQNFEICSRILFDKPKIQRYKEACKDSLSKTPSYIECIVQF